VRSLAAVSLLLALGACAAAPTAADASPVAAPSSEEGREDARGAAPDAPDASLDPEAEVDPAPGDATPPIATRYTNPVLPSGCADPGVLRDDDGTYVLSCTSGGAATAFPIYTSRDLVTWKRKGAIFPAGTKPAWSTGNAFWAPEIHKIGTRYVAYFSAEAADGRKAVGAASAPTATGPFTDVGAPLVTDATIGVIDASAITTSKGESYLLWKIAGLAVGKPTPIRSQRLTADGLAVTGSVATLITNDLPWEGKSTEGPFMVERNGMFYLFYSGGIYTNPTYAVGVARAPSPHEPMTKLPRPILTTNDAWVGPGHNAIVPTERGGTAIVYHAWEKGCVATAGCTRKLLIDEIVWRADGWPSVPKGATSTVQATF
jgi:beta-xylosidase